MTHEIKSMFPVDPEGLDEIAESLLHTTPKQEDAPLKSLNGFEYVPSIKLYVSKERTLQGKDWNAQKSELHSKNERMPTINEFKEFIKHLRTEYSNKKEAQKILDEIYKVEGDWRSEYLDAKFENVGEKWFLNYYKFSPQGSIEQVREPLALCLMKDKTPGISLDDWLANANIQGLPKSNISDGKLYYWCPTNGAVAGFCADSDGAGLGCVRVPSDANSSLGVRAVRCHEKILEANKK